MPWQGLPRSQSRFATGTTIALLAALATTGCAPVTAEQREDREYRRLVHERKFLDFRADCKRQGKRIYIFASQSVGRDGSPHRGDRYTCN